METIQSKLNHMSPSVAAPLLEDSGSSCFRCGGFLVATFCISPEQGTTEWEIPVWKCLQCGDLFDSTILKNRSRSQHQPFIHN